MKCFGLTLIHRDASSIDRWQFVTLDVSATQEFVSQHKQITPPHPMPRGSNDHGLHLYIHTAYRMPIDGGLSEHHIDIQAQGQAYFGGE